ncbi:MAG TPA: type II toxin-antitoxin system prevent-host-death family antitoxin [Phycisphaerales bacterium]|jgi:prevent-host-death family protein|nr:type II toxin-antitoxin system prevent-host-death family antitoxin [Phycisphaerales bacterium]
MTISLEEAQRQLAQLLDTLAKGEELVITRDGRPVARLIAEPNGTPHAKSKPDRILGSAKGLVRISSDFDAPLDEFGEYTD